MLKNTYFPIVSNRRDFVANHLPEKIIKGLRALGVPAGVTQCLVKTIATCKKRILTGELCI
jgi:hypothetical protein